jgi:aspartate carbamoyltransferase
VARFFKTKGGFMAEKFVPQPIHGVWEGKDFISMLQVDARDIDDIYEETRLMRQLRLEKVAPELLNDQHQLGNVFYEASTRTSTSFANGWRRLGGGVETISNVNYSSISKGESLVHTMKTLERYSEAIVLRHSQVGAAALAASVLEIPVINAGDGVGEHPTQGLLDGFTIDETLGGVDGKVITIAGDLLYGRTTHSLIQWLALHKPSKINLVAPKEFQMPPEFVEAARQQGIIVELFDELEPVLATSDGLYMVRMQRERIQTDSKLTLRQQIEQKVAKVRDYGSEAQNEFLDSDFDDSLRMYLEISEKPKTEKDRALADLVLYSVLNSLPEVKTLTPRNGFNDNIYVLDISQVQRMKESARIYHPLPIAGEITPEVDDDPRAVYFDEVENGMYLRMALEAKIMGKSAADYHRKQAQNLRLHEEIQAYLAGLEAKAERPDDVAIDLIRRLGGVILNSH